MLVNKWRLEEIRLDVPSTFKMDVSITYDGVTVVSARFLEIYVGSQLCGLRFHEIAQGFSILAATRRVAFDTAARRTALKNHCVSCGQFQTVAGATPAFLLPPVDVSKEEFVWTDVEFGSGDEQHPLLICGELACAALRKARLRGLDVFHEVRGG
jgi:hypothetical protein